MQRSVARSNRHSLLGSFALPSMLITMPEALLPCGLMTGHWRQGRCSFSPQIDADAQLCLPCRAHRGGIEINIAWTFHGRKLNLTAVARPAAATTKEAARLLHDAVAPFSCIGSRTHTAVAGRMKLTFCIRFCRCCQLCAGGASCGLYSLDDDNEYEYSE